jgi:hypothetical protein
MVNLLCDPLMAGDAIMLQGIRIAGEIMADEQFFD